MNKEDLLRKIKALADHGIDGEQENAQELLHRLMLKYNVDEKDLVDDAVEDYTIRYKTEYEKKLIIQIIYAVQGDNYKIWDYRYGIKKVGYSATAAEHIEIEAMFEFYSYHWHRDIEIFYLAFLKKNNIYPSVDKVTDVLDTDSLSEEKKEQLQRVEKMSYSLDEHIRHKTIEYKGD